MSKIKLWVFFYKELIFFDILEEAFGRLSTLVYHNPNKIL